MKRVAIVQARLGSSRYPRKVLKELPPCSGITVLEHLITNLSKCNNIDEICFAIPEVETDDTLFDILKNYDVTVVRGSETDVLSRFITAAFVTKADIIVRVTADNPLTWIRGIDQQVHFLEQNPSVDYVHQRKLPLGTMVETFSLKTLEKLDYLSKTNVYREHVTFYLIENPKGFNIVDLEVPENLIHPELRLTFDTEGDYKLLAKIYEKCFTQEHGISLELVVDYLTSNPQLKGYNSDVRQVPSGIMVEAYYK